MDATVHSNLAQKYGVKGYPTIKAFAAGKKGKATDYNGPREAAGIVQYALQALDAAGVGPKITQVTNTDTFTDACGQSGKVCVVLFVPHIYDSSAKARNGYIETLGEVAKSLRGQPLTFVW